MPLLSVAESNPFIDGRQSDRALAIRTGVERHLAEAGWATLPELTLDGGRRADLVALCPKGRITIIEVKSSVADFMADSKWSDYLPWCDLFYFATSADVPAEIFPEEIGLMLADSYGAHIVREAEEERITPANRRKVQMRFARAAALRLQRCCAHAGLDAADLAGDDG